MSDTAKPPPPAPIPPRRAPAFGARALSEQAALSAPRIGWTAAAIYGAGLAASLALGSEQIRVVDGDTIARGERSIRILGLDAPESWPSAAGCDAERARGRSAAATLRRLIDTASEIEIRHTGELDRYGRLLARLIIDGEDAAELMIAAGFARPYGGKAGLRRRPWPDCK